MENKESKEIHNPLVELAYNAIEAYLRAHIKISPPRTYYKILESKAACFVSLKTDKGDLRGCIGTVEHREVTLGWEIISNAIAAATRDPRFTPVTADELPGLTITVDVLERLRECSKDSLDPKEFGIVIEQGDRRGVLLPNLPTVDTVDQQISIAASKGGIDLNQEYRIFRFRSERFDKDSVVA